MKVALAAFSLVLSTTATSTLGFALNSAGSSTTTTGIPTRKASFIVSSHVPSSPTVLYGTPGMDLSGNSWQPDSAKMGSTGVYVYNYVSIAVCVLDSGILDPS